jgi:hypothetical protein
VRRGRIEGRQLHELLEFLGCLGLVPVVDVQLIVNGVVAEPLVGFRDTGFRVRTRL